MGDDSSSISRRAVLGTTGTAIAAALGYTGYVSDIDGDGISNGKELQGRTDPLKEDSNGDGVNDAGEVMGDHSEIVQKAYEHAKANHDWAAREEILSFGSVEILFIRHNIA